MKLNIQHPIGQLITLTDQDKMDLTEVLTTTIVKLLCQDHDRPGAWDAAKKKLTHLKEMRTKVEAATTVEDYNALQKPDTVSVTDRTNLSRAEFGYSG